jgi:plastocyanin
MARAPSRWEGRRMRVLPVLAAAAVLAISGCGSDDESPSGGGASGGSSQATTVALEDNAFAPATISGEPGSKVTLELENTGQAEHTFTLDSQKVDEELESGAKETVEVTIPKSGSVEFYCRYHKAGGMVGTLGAGAADSGGKSKSAYY